MCSTRRDDRLIWDVGHQAYPHKILTGRRDRIRTLRQGGGLSGFTKRAESEYDPFGAAHSSTSISAGLGMAVARDLDGKKHNVICVIGDGAMSAGMAYEAMNNAGAMDSRLIVILNDNDMSIAPPVGAMSAYLARLISGETYRHLRELGEAARQDPAQGLGTPRGARRGISRAASGPAARCSRSSASTTSARSTVTISIICSRCLRNVRDTENGPILIHVVTQKGKGYEPAETSADKFHGVDRFNVITGAQEPSRAAAPPSYTKVFARCADRGGESRRQDRRHHGGDAVRHRARPLRRGVSRPQLRCRHRRAACRDLRRRPRGGRLQAVRRNLFDLPAARL